MSAESLTSVRYYEKRVKTNVKRIWLASLKSLAVVYLLSLASNAVAENNLSVEDLKELTQYNVALVTTERGWGSGFFVTGKAVITNHHIVANASEILVKQRHAEVNARVYWSDAKLDLAVILLTEAIPGSHPVTISGNTQGLAAGTSLFALGIEGDADKKFDLSLQVVPKHVFGEIEQLVDVYGWPWVKENRTRDRSDDMLMMQHSAQVTKGYSGGPLYDTCGRVIGVITMPPRGVEGVNYASDVGELIDKLATERLLNRQLNRLVNKDRSACTPIAIDVATLEATESEGGELDDLRSEVAALQQIVTESAEQKQDAERSRQETEEQMLALRDEIERSKQAEEVNQQALNSLTRQLRDLEKQNEQQLAVLQQSELKLSEAETSLEDANVALGEVQQEVATIERESQEERAKLLQILIIVASVVLALFLIAIVLIASLRKKVADVVIRAKDSITRVAARRGSSTKARPTPSEPSSVRTIRIGRGRDMDFRFESDAVSRFHAELEITKGSEDAPDTYSLSDVGSANGTRILREERWEEFTKGSVQLDDMMQFGDEEVTIRRIVESWSVTRHT